MRTSLKLTQSIGPLWGYACALSPLLCALGLAAVILPGCSEPKEREITPPKNVQPSIKVIEPDEDLNLYRGDPFIVRWEDSDPDDNASISIDLVQADGTNEFAIAEGIAENDVLSDRFVINTEGIVSGTYFVRLTIDDGVNPPVAEFAVDEETGARVRVTIHSGGDPSNTPPQVFVVAPQTNIGLSQGDVLTVSIRPTQADPGPVDPGVALHYDPTDPAEVTILLDLDSNPNNDNFSADDDPGNIILQRQLIEEDAFAQIDFNITIDVQDIPVHEDGLPYFIRAHITDGLSSAYKYAAGRLYVLELVQGSAESPRSTVDLGQVGRTLAGARFVGSNPRSNVGTKMASAMDIDNDGIGDFVLVAQFGNPRNLGNIGEAYVIYGPRTRFGGQINVNSVGPVHPQTSFGRVRGTVMHSHSDATVGWVLDLDQGDDLRIREQNRPLTAPYTLGITDVVAIRRLHTAANDPTGLGCDLPELIFGMPHSEYFATTRDDDLGDDPSNEEQLCFYCYPDTQPNNACSSKFPWDPDDPGPNTDYFEGDVYAKAAASEQKEGTVAVFYGENFVDPDEPIKQNCTVVTQPTEEVYSLNACGSQKDEEEQANRGARFSVAIFDSVGDNLIHDPLGFQIDPLNAHYGMNVGVLPDVDLNGLDEIIISAPRNELEVQEILARDGESHPHIQSRLSRGNITIFLGQDYSTVVPNVASDGTAHIPFMDTRIQSSCSDTPVGRDIRRDLDLTAGLPELGWFSIRGEEPSDKLGSARSAGDFNFDGPADILAGAPFADPLLDTNKDGLLDTEVQDAGTVYIIYLHFPFDHIDLACAGAPSEECPRPPMLRIFGESDFDHLGLKQESGQDVNGDGIHDVFIGSKNYNGQGLTDNGFVGIIFGGREINGDRVVSDIATPILEGTRFYGSHSGDWAGADLSTGGDFNADGIGDLLISAPRESVTIDNEDQPRRGVVYLVFGGRHLENQVFTLEEVGTPQLPGIVFVGPYQQNTPDAFELDKTVFVRAADCDPDVNEDGQLEDIECLCDPEVEENCVLLEEADGSFALRRINDAAPSRVAFIGDVNADGFDDIMIGNPTADFVDTALPEPHARRPDAGEAYLVYGNDLGANKTTP